MQVLLIRKDRETRSLQLLFTRDLYLSYEGMAQAFPTLARDNPEALKGAREQLVQFIKSAAMVSTTIKVAILTSSQLTK